MSVIIRLQNLPWAANAADIRHYFQGLSIPEGGVHIVGGEKGDAFISFSTDEDARQAMLSDGGCIKDVQIKLLLSSRNEMQKVIETARQQAMQLTHVYMQQMQQPQLPPMVGSLPPLTAKVLPQPQQQVRPDHLVAAMRRNQPIMDTSSLLIQSQEKQQHPQLSPKSSENKDRDDKVHKRERTRSKSRDRRSKSSRGGSSRRDRSRSRDRRRRDRSRGRDRSRDRHRSSGGGRDSSSRGSGGKSYRSRSPQSTKSMDNISGNKVLGVGDQHTSIRPWVCQYDSNIQQQVVADNHQQNSAAMNAGTKFTQFRTPPQPPSIPGLNPNSYTQQSPQQMMKNNWGTMGGEERQKQPYVPVNDFRKNVYGTAVGSDDEDDRQDEFNKNFHRRFNDNTSNQASRKGPLGQDFHSQQGFNQNKGSKFYKSQQPMLDEQQIRGSHQQFNEFGGGGSGPRYNQQSRYTGGGGSGGQEILDGGNGHGNPDSESERPSRFSSIHDGGRPSRFNSIQDSGRPSRFSVAQDSGRPSRFNPAVPQHIDDSEDSNLNDTKKFPPRYNDRYRYDVRNTQVPRVDGLCVEVNNMFNHFSYGDIRKLFEGIHIDGSAIKIQKHRQGVAFIRFDNNHNKNLAMKLNGTAYKGRNIVVKHLENEAYERENTDDRPYPSILSAADSPTVVDHVDLVDDDDDDQPGDDKNKQDTKQNATANDDQSEDDCNLVVCEKNVKDVVTKDGGEEQPSTSSSLHERPTKYLKLEQLPITVTEDDVLNELDSEGEVRRVIFYPDGEFIGAVLEFHNVDQAVAARKRFDCVLLGSTPVPVLQCTHKEYLQFKRKSGFGGGRFSSDNGGGGGAGGGGIRHHNRRHLVPQQQPSDHSSQVPQPPNIPMSGGPGGRSNCLYLYGLPTSVTNTDITQFFADISVLPDKIHIMLSKFGRPTGESYCEFSTNQQAQSALIKDQQFMGPNLVYVEPISRSDMIQAITKPMQQHNNHHQDIAWGGGMRGGGMRGGVGGGPPRQQNMLSSPRQLHHQGPQSSYGGGGNNGPYGGDGGRPHQQQYMNSGGRGGGGGYTPRMRGPPGLGPNTGPDGFGQPGCVVALDNVPYRADVQEIVDFFDGFDLNSQNVIRRFNDFGKPTGEARVNLRNPQEAIRAVRVLQNKPIYNRPVRLTLL